MKIAFLCLAIYAYVAYASDDSQSREPVAQHAVQENLPNQGYVPNGQQPQYYYPSRPQPPPRRRNGLDLSNPIVLYILLRALNPPKITAATTTMAATTTAAPDPLAGWTQVGDENCYYRLSDTTATWEAAENECEGAVDDGRLAVTGFNAPLAERIALMTALQAIGVTFFIGADGLVTAGTLGGEAFIDPVNGEDVKTADSSFTTELADSVNADGTVCGRVDAADDENLVFEDCDTTARRYMCEVCM